MTPLHVIASMLAIQVIGYVLLDRYNLSAWKYLIFGIILVLHFFVLPGYFFPNNPTHEPMCGMPVLAITLGFWILGGGVTLMTHVIYMVSTMNKTKQITSPDGL